MSEQIKKELKSLWNIIGKNPNTHTQIEQALQRVEKEERERISQMIKEMPDTFPELESDDYDKAYQDAKKYMLDKLKNLN